MGRISLVGGSLVGGTHSSFLTQFSDPISHHPTQGLLVVFVIVNTLGVLLWKRHKSFYDFSFSFGNDLIRRFRSDCYCDSDDCDAYKFL